MDIKGFKGRDGTVHSYDYRALANIPEGSPGTTLELDTTLTQSGKAADAKAVGDAISKFSGGNDDLTGYATEQYVQDYAQPKGDYLTEVPEGYAKTEDIPTKPEDIGAQPSGNYLTEVPSGYATEEFVTNKIAEAELGGKEVDLSGYAQKSELPTKVSQLQNDSGYLTEHQDISGKLDISELPTAINTALAQAKASGEFDGKDGADGQPGKDGADGAPGEKGDKGDTGATGPQGPKGDTGATGPAGPQGPKGEPGEKPQKGVDYFTEADKEEFLNNIDAVRYVEQTLTEEQKAQARSNIGAAALENIEPGTGNMPKVFLTGDITGITKYDPKDLKIEYIDGVNDFDGYVEMKVQGASSQYYDKKNFTIKMFTDSSKGTKLKKSFRGWGTQNKFCLKANFIDHTHARNVVCARLWGDIVASRTNIPELLANSPNYGAVDGFPIKVYINGVYQGLYTWNIPKDKWTFGMDDEANQILLACERNNNGEIPSVYPSTEFRKLWDGTELEWKIEFPDEVTADIKSKFNALINFVMTASDADFVSKLNNYLDVESALDYYLFMYFICDLDGLAKNMLMAYDGTKWYCSAYDLDGVFGLGSAGNILSGAASSYICPDSYNDNYSLLWQRIEKLMYTQLQDRYAVLRNGALSYTNVIKRFEDFTDLISKELYDEDSIVYPSIPSVDTSNIRQIRNFMVQRGAYVDECIAALDGSSFCDVDYDGVDDYKTVSSISAVFTQEDTVITTDASLETLKPMLTVKAKYADGTTSTIIDGYTLSGTLTSGNSIVTVKYKTFTTTFTVVCEGAAAGYTNQVPISVDTDGSVFNGTGYKDNSRLNSSGLVKDEDRRVTGFIPCKAGDVLRFCYLSDTNAMWTDNSGFHTTINLYDSTKAHLGQMVSTNNSVYGILTAEELTKVTKVNGVWEYTVLNNASIAWVRFTVPITIDGAELDGEDLAVTVNEEIT